MTSRAGRSIVACLALLCAKCGSPSSDPSPGNGGEPGDAQGGSPALGEACDTDEECPEGATCLREGGDSLFGGGPPRGLCAAECTGVPEECERFANAVC